jgi:hypothetical protein
MPPMPVVGSRRQAAMHEPSTVVMTTCGIADTWLSPWVT